MKNRWLLLVSSLLVWGVTAVPATAQTQLSQVHRVRIDDPFWSPKYEIWRKTTALDVLDKFEGKHLKTAEEQQKNNVIANFDKIAAGKRGAGGHAGMPWFDGLIYESIRGIGDLLGHYPDAALQARVDGIIDRIDAAQQADPLGYLNTYTDLMEPTHRWGDNGGFLRWQHDVYNAGMLVEAGVHYYKATGKMKLLAVATRYANYMAKLMGPAPKRNIVPAHSGPEEALVKLYWLYKDEPALAKKIGVPVREKAYYDLATFWIENRGKHVGRPLWQTWGNDKSERWIKEQQYKNSPVSSSARPTWGDYAQDSISIFDQKTIEGHAVRATLLATGVAAAALENRQSAYRQTVNRLWNNMVGRRLFVTGGVGAIAHDEKFGADYFLPTDAYLETCAAVGAGFFSQRMNELTGDAKYMDEFERVLYNNVLTGVSLSGTNYTYQNPLNAHDHARWDWHSCPCCPPMFLKMVSALPDYIYASAANNLFVNLFIGSQADIQLANTRVKVNQTTSYPWQGSVRLIIDPQKAGAFSVHVRIPGWARGKENPFDLYQSDLNQAVTIKVNGKLQAVTVANGYAVLARKWQKGDHIDLSLPMTPRIIKANGQVKALTDKVALASGPLIYCLEAADNEKLDALQWHMDDTLTLTFRADVLDGVNVMTGRSTQPGRAQRFTAIPYYAAGNRAIKGYKVWLPKTEKITVNANQVENRIDPLIYGSNIEDVNHEIYGGFYDQRIFGESFEEPATGVDHGRWKRYAGFWTAKDGAVTIIPGRNTTSDVFMNGTHPIGVEPDQSAKLVYDREEFADATLQADIRFSGPGESGALLVRVAKPGVGHDVFDGYEVSLSRDGKKLRLGKHRQDFRLLTEAAVQVDPEAWNTLKVKLTGPEISVFLNQRPVLRYRDENAPLLTGNVGLRTWKSGLAFRHVSVEEHGNSRSLPLVLPNKISVSYNWDMIQAGKATVAADLDSLTAYNGSRSQRVHLINGSGKVGVANRGLNRWGIAVRSGQSFQGRAYLKANGLTGAVTVALESADGRKTYASQQLTGISKNWKKYPFTLTATSMDRQARLAIYITSTGQLWIDQVVLMSTGEDQFERLPIRADLGKSIVNEGVTFLRYAGTMVNSPEYRFKKMIGDPDKRPPYRGHWNRYSTNGLGIEEFLRYCEAAHITPCFTINCYETPQDMADMIDYLNGAVTTEWGAKRAQNGHTNPYGVQYIEIGNEEVIFNGDKREAYQEYVERYKLLANAMKQKDPSLQLIHAAWWRPDSPNMAYVFRELNGKADYWDLHVGGDDPKAGAETDKQLTNMLRLFKQWDPNTTMKIAVFEENGSKHGIQRALGHATNMNAIRRHNAHVLTSSPANALEPYGQNDNDWSQGQIFFTPDQVWGMPPFFSQKMQADNHLPLRVYSEVAGSLDVTATRSEDKRTLVLHVVNTGAEIINANLNLSDFDGAKTNAAIYTLAGPLTARNSPAEPEKYKTEIATHTFAGAIPTYDFPANSYTIIRFGQ